MRAVGVVALVLLGLAPLAALATRGLRRVPGTEETGSRPLPRLVLEGLVALAVLVVVVLVIVVAAR